GRRKTRAVTASSGASSPRLMSSWGTPSARSSSPLEMWGIPSASLSSRAWVPLPAPGPPNNKTSCGPRVGSESCSGGARRSKRRPQLASARNDLAADRLDAPDGGPDVSQRDDRGLKACVLDGLTDDA